MVKGGDWVFGSLLVDEALQAVGLTRPQLLPEGAARWMLDTREWPGVVTEYADQSLAMTATMLSDPRHFFRSYSATGIGHLITAPAPRSVSAP